VNVFIIVNEWVDIQGHTSSEVVGATYFDTENEAWESLDIIAKAHDTRLYIDDTNLVLEGHVAHLQTEEYYILELAKKESN